MNQPVPTIGIGSFCLANNVFDPSRTMYRHTTDDDEPHWEWLLEQVQQAWLDRAPGYRDGVVLVTLEVPEGVFTCPIVSLNALDKATGATEDAGSLLVGEFVPRRGVDEAPRKNVMMLRPGHKAPILLQSASHVGVVLYRADVLAEGDHRNTDCDWEVVTLLGKMGPQGEPMSPDTLMHNHFGSSGGSDTKMDPETFEATMRESFLFWKDKARLAPDDLRQRMVIAMLEEGLDEANHYKACVLLDADPEG